MSTKYTGGFITKSPVAPTTSAASGIWTLDQQQQAQKAGTWPSPPIFIEDLFSTFLYTGTSATQTITNNIDLSNQGGLVWIKQRSGTSFHALSDTASGITNNMASNAAGAQNVYTSTVISAATTSGFTLANNGDTNANTQTYVSWTFREQPKFFDIVTWTGTGGSGTRAISHNLGSTPGAIFIKKTSASNNWAVYHRSSDMLCLNSTAAAGAVWSGDVTAVSSTTFTVLANTGLNDSGATYVAYLFAHDAGGFPVSGGGSTNGITCGSYVGNGSTNGPTVTLGYEPQWLLIKSTAGGVDWWIVDNMRGMPVDGFDWRIRPNTSDADNNGDLFFAPTATGFKLETSSFNVNSSGNTYIYIAIRRGPMKPPTVGTSVYGAETWTGNAASPRTFTSANWTFPADLVTVKGTDNAAWWNVWGARLTGGGTLSTNSTGAELSPAGSVAGYVSSFNQTGYTAITGTSSISNYNASADAYVSYNLRRAPSFMDVVCGTGTGAASTFTHNLGVAPELVICKSRNGTDTWRTLSPTLAKYGGLDTTNAFTNSSIQFYFGNDTTYVAPTATTVYLGQSAFGNGSTYIAYLFATCPGVSKVGSYTGTAGLLTIDCGFTSGARFVMIKRTDSTGGWFYYDSVRGITSGNDPYLFFNVSDAQVTGTNYVDTDTTGFKVTAAAPAAINANGGTYIFLAIA
jgi:hypothetical protein